VDRGRLEAFSDGVFAVAITLLALTLTVKGPGDHNGSLGHQLADLWPGFLAYLVSFATIGIIWVNHHALLANVAVVTRTLLFLNLLLLFFVVLLAPATGAVADYLGRAGFDPKLAVAVYGVVLFGMSVGFGSMLEWSLGAGRMFVPVPPDKRWAARRRFAGGGLVYLMVVGLAFASAAAAFALSGAVALYYVFERTPASSDGPPDDPAAR
jgi:TMEM175 potassium channel family protein